MTISLRWGRLRWGWTLFRALVALAAGGGAQAALTINTAQSTAWDPVNNSLLPKAVPGAQVDYTLSVFNGPFQATAHDVVVTDPIPPRLKFYVGTGNPVTVTISMLSGLTYSYTGLGSTDDGLDFSDDHGSSWTYRPVAGADGSDPNVTNIRVKTGGNQVAGDSFSIIFRTVIR